MKSSTTILYALVVLSLTFSIVTFAIVADKFEIFTPSSPSNTQPPPTTASPTQTPITPAPLRSNISISYTETNRQNISDTTTRVTLTVNAQYLSGSEVTIIYSQFYIEPTVFRTVPLPVGTIYPLNTGTITMGPSHLREDFGLTFEFPTMSYDGTGYTHTFYTLKFNGTDKINWLNPDYL
jgi:hypothetical protein